MVKDLSGGERRRLSIGVEAVRDPAVLVLDEPTSGLDSAPALRAKAESRGRTVVLSIHQPGARIVNMFDAVLLLAANSVLHHGSVDALHSLLAGAGLGSIFYDLGDNKATERVGQVHGAYDEGVRGDRRQGAPAAHLGFCRSPRRAVSWQRGGPMGHGNNEGRRWRQVGELDELCSSRREKSGGLMENFHLLLLVQSIVIPVPI